MGAPRRTRRTQAPRPASRRATPARRRQSAAMQDELYRKLGQLSRYIVRTTGRIQQLRPAAYQSASQLPQACDHLTDLIRVTAEGAHSVMEMAESIMADHARLAEDLKGLAAFLEHTCPDAPERGWVTGMHAVLRADDQRLVEMITKLSFQDLISQRIRMILQILDEIQRRLLEMVVVFGEPTGPTANREDPNGEQLLRALDARRTESLGQDMVNEILAEYGFD